MPQKLLHALQIGQESKDISKSAILVTMRSDFRPGQKVLSIAGLSQKLVLGR